MRLVGKTMVIQLKDATKMIGISIITFCAVFVCSMFLNFMIDIVQVKDLVTSPMAMQLYEAQNIMAKAISGVSGGCLLATSFIMLIFYVKHYIDVHKKELGILKALGYSNFQIAKSFWIFGSSVLIGTSLGYGCSFLLMPKFYEAMNEDGYLPQIAINFNPILLVCLVIVPTIMFALLAVAYAYMKLKCPTLQLLQGQGQRASKKHKVGKESNVSFLQEMKKSTVSTRKSLVFFIAFASFCFSSMMQMAMSITEISSVMFSAILLIIGLILSVTTLFLAITTVMKGNTKNIAMMRVFGYSYADCKYAILNGYRPIAYIGFVIGTIYQYALMKIILSLFSKDLLNGIEVSFDIPAFIIVLVVFVCVYEWLMHVYSKKIESISVKEVMLD